MNNFISEEEYAEISAKIDLSLEDISFSSTDNLNVIDEEPQSPPSPDPAPPTKSILNFESWKKFIEVRESADKEQSLLQEHFSESLKDLRKVTNEKEIILPAPLQEIPEDPQEEIEIFNINEGDQGTLIEISEDVIVKFIEKVNEEPKFTVNERQLMTEEDFLSGLIENWIRKERKLVDQENKKEEKRVLVQIEEKKKRLERIEQAEEQAVKVRIEKKEKMEQEKMQKIRKMREEAQEADENLAMSREDEFSLLFKIFLKTQENEKNLLREQKTMATEDELGLLYRNLVPTTKKKKYFTEFSPYHPTVSTVSIIFPSELVFPKYLKPKPPLFDPQKSQLPLPVPVPVSKVPDLKDSGDLEQPTLSNSLPYPIDSKSLSLEVKHEGLRSISGLSFFNNLQVLILSLNKLEKISNLPGTLKHLDLSQNLISTIPDLNLPLLEELVLDLNQINILTGLQKCVNLRTLSVSNNKLTKIEGLERCKLIEKVLVYRNKIKEIPKDTFVHNPYLVHLDLGRNKLRAVHFLNGLTVLKSLILYQNMISQVQSINLPILQELWLNGNSLKTLDFIKNCPLLENFRVEDNAISSVDTFECPILRNFNISFNSLNKFADIVNCIQNNRSLIYFSFNDNPIVLVHPELLPMFNELIVKALPYIQELNNTPRTSLSKTGLNKAGLSIKAFELHQIDVYTQKIKRKNEIIKYISPTMINLLYEIPCKVLNINIQETQVSSKGFEYFWYNARANLYKHTLAARVIQVWWKYRQLKKKRVIQKYKKNTEEIIKIQKIFRGWKARKNLVNSRYNPAKIVKIQATFRGFSLRNKLKKALGAVKIDDLNLDEFGEVNLDDVDLNYDFNNELVIPKNLDLTKFFVPVPVEESKTPKLPPLKPGGQRTVNFNAGSNVRPASNKSLQSSTQSSLPPLVKNRVREEMEKHIEEWGFCNNEAKEALQYRIMKKMQRKNKGKKTTADERLEKFRKSIKK